MRYLILVLAVILSTSAWAGTAFLKSSYVDGVNRICVYDHLGSEYVITIPAGRICKISIEVP